MTKFSFSYLSYNYFFDLFALMLLLVPCYQILSGARARRILMIFARIYLVYFIAPRLLVLMIPFWCLVFILQRFLAWKEKAGGVGIFAKDSKPGDTLLVFLPCNPVQ